MPTRCEMKPVRRRRPPRRPAAAGFSLAELAVSMGVLSLVMLGLGALFQIHERLGRQQIQLAEMQQSSRGAQNELVRMTRMAGRGGLSRGLAPAFLPVAVRNSVSAAGPDAHIALGVGSSPSIRPGTDVLTVRGVINMPVYQTAETAMVLDDRTSPTRGTLTIRSPSPRGLVQDLGPLAKAIADGTPEPLIVVSSSSDQIYSVVALAPSRSSVDDPNDPRQIVAAFDIGSPGGTALADKYLALSPNGVFPRRLRSVVFVGILEEYRYYVREQAVDPSGATAGVVPRLSRARFLAGSEVPHPSDPTMATDVADGIIDLQVAIGIDVAGDGRLDETVGAPSGGDDWLFNAAADTPLNANFWNGAGGRLPSLSHLRITTLARTDRPDPRYTVRPIDRLEDRVYNETSYPANEEERRERLYRRRQTTTLVDMRNQG